MQLTLGWLILVTATPRFGDVGCESGRSGGANDCAKGYVHTRATQQQLRQRRHGLVLELRLHYDKSFTSEGGFQRLPYEQHSSPRAEMHSNIFYCNLVKVDDASCTAIVQPGDASDSEATGFVRSLVGVALSCKTVRWFFFYHSLPR